MNYYLLTTPTADALAVTLSEGALRDLSCMYYQRPMLRSELEHDHSAVELTLAGCSTKYRTAAHPKADLYAVTARGHQLLDTLDTWRQAQDTNSGANICINGTWWAVATKQAQLVDYTATLLLVRVPLPYQYTWENPQHAINLFGCRAEMDILFALLATVGTHAVVDIAPKFYLKKCNTVMPLDTPTPAQFGTL